MRVNRPNVMAALERAGLWPPSKEVTELVDSACGHPQIDADEILELSLGSWGTEEQSARGVLMVLMRAGVFVIIKVKHGPRSTEMVRLRCLYEWYQDLIEDDELDGAGVFFVAKEGHHDFLLSFPTPRERDRMFHGLFHAHRGNFAPWGVQLDPGDFVIDFNRLHAEISATGPADASRLRDWMTETYGEFDPLNALALARAWRDAELRDIAGRSGSARVSLVSGGDTWARADRQPEARRVIVQLGERLYDAGLLGPPYDERRFTDEAIRPIDPGPERLSALMMLALLARATRDPRATEWLDAARAGIPTVPASGFSPRLRELWGDIGPLPTNTPPPPPVVPITDDAEVRALAAGDAADASWMPSVDGLSAADLAALAPFLSSPTAAAGVRAFDQLSPSAPPGWRKFIVHRVCDLTHEVWQQQRSAEDAGRLAHWVIAVIEEHGWGPDGRRSALGQDHVRAMDLAVDTGVGLLQFDPVTGAASAPRR